MIDVLEMVERELLLRREFIRKAETNRNLAEFKWNKRSDIAPERPPWHDMEHDFVGIGPIRSTSKRRPSRLAKALAKGGGGETIDAPNGQEGRDEVDNATTH